MYVLPVDQFSPVSMRFHCGDGIRPSASPSNWIPETLVIAKRARILPQVLDPESLFDLILISAAKFIETNVAGIGNAVSKSI